MQKNTIFWKHLLGIIPQTVFTLWGSDGVGLECLWFLRGPGRATGSAQTLYLCTKIDLTLKNTP